MRAVIIATGRPPEGFLLDDRHPVPMLPLGDRPCLQHVAEHFVRQGVRRFDWVLCHLPEEIEQFLGGGERWGAWFRYHLVRDETRPYEGLRALALGGEDDPILLGHADRLPDIRLAELNGRPPARGPVVYGWRDADAAWRWSGWAVLSPAAWRGLPRGAVDEDGLRRHLLSGAAGTPRWREIPRPLSVQDFGEVLAANGAVLRGQFPGLLLGGREAAPGVRLARNVVLHPSARLVAPVYLGENCEVAAEAQVGPDVVVGPGCVIDRRCTIANAVILPGTYIGEGLELGGVLVDRDRVARALPGNTLRVAEDCAVADLRDSCLGRWAGRLVSMALGLVLLLAAAPLLLLTALVLKLWRRGPVLHVTRVVRLPARRGDSSWSTYGLWRFCPPTGQSASPGARHFLLQFLPALFNVARGDLNLVGLPPRTPGEVQRLWPDWQGLYLQARAGVVSEALLDLDAPCQEEVYATEAAHAMAGGPVRDLALFLRYLFRVVWGPARKARARTVAGQAQPTEAPPQGPRCAARPRGPERFSAPASHQVRGGRDGDGGSRSSADMFQVPEVGQHRSPPRSGEQEGGGAATRQRVV
jgi:lipopolysaccharide/colanic/teichoic acid biosynthesis glycosyltransferase